MGLPSTTLSWSDRPHSLTIQAAVDRVVAEAAHRNELRLAYVRAVVLLISLGLDGLVFFFPEPLIGQPQVAPTVVIISLCASLFALGLVVVLRQGLSWPVLRRWQVAIPVFDSLLLWAFITNIFQVLGQTQPLIFANVAAFCCLMSVSGGMRLSRQAAWLTTGLALVNFLYAAILFQVDVAVGLFAAITILGTGIMGLWMATVFRRHVKNESGRALMERFLPKTVVEAAFESPLTLMQRPQKREVTVLVTDLRNFTQFAETLEPQAVLDFLNRYQGLLARLVDRHGGWVDKFMGDGMLAVFGAPDQLDNAAENALQAAIAMVAEVKQISPLPMGVGLHSGPVVAGCLGAGNHLEFTVIGDTVNVASRIETLTKTLGHPLLISASTQKQLPLWPLVSVGIQPIRGRMEGLELFTLPAA
jgi:class 3 adenylate cyclase